MIGSPCESFATVRAVVTPNESPIQYHDAEWGVPMHDDERLFEF
jgi:3-methyladenine DNA glycosylase Tag